MEVWSAPHREGERHCYVVCSSLLSNCLDCCIDVDGFDAHDLLFFLFHHQVKDWSHPPWQNCFCFVGSQPKLAAGTSIYWIVRVLIFFQIYIRFLKKMFLLEGSCQLPWYSVWTQALLLHGVLSESHLTVSATDCSDNSCSCYTASLQALEVLPFILNSPEICLRQVLTNSCM